MAAQYMNDYQNAIAGANHTKNQNSVASIGSKKGNRPKTNQSSRRVFGASQPSLDQGRPNQMEMKNYSLTMAGNPSQNNMVNDFRHAHLNSLKQLD